MPTAGATAGVSGVASMKRSGTASGSVLDVPALLLSAWATTATMAMGTIFVALLGFQVAIGNIQTLPSDFFSGKSVATCPLVRRRRKGFKARASTVRVSGSSRSGSSAPAR